MTAREHIKRQRRKSFKVSLLGFALMLVGILMDKFYVSFWPLIAAGVVLFLGGVLYSSLGCKCVSCSGRIPMPPSQSRSRGDPWNQFRFCPFCGISLDAEIEESRKA